MRGERARRRLASKSGSSARTLGNRHTFWYSPRLAPRSSATLDPNLVFNGRAPLAHRSLLRDDLAIANYFEAFEWDAREGRGTHLERFGGLQLKTDHRFTQRPGRVRFLGYEALPILAR